MCCLGIECSLQLKNLPLNKLLSPQSLLSHHPRQQVKPQLNCVHLLSACWTKKYCSSPHKRQLSCVDFHFFVNCRCLIHIPTPFRELSAANMRNFVNRILQVFHKSCNLAIFPIIFIWFLHSCA